MLQHYNEVQKRQFDLKISKTEEKQLFEVVQRNFNVMTVPGQDLRFMMNFYYKRYSPIASDTHFQRQITKKMGCPGCRRIVIIFMQRWYNFKTYEYKQQEEENAGGDE